MLQGRNPVIVCPKSGLLCESPQFFSRESVLPRFPAFVGLIIRGLGGLWLPRFWTCRLSSSVFPGWIAIPANLLNESGQIWLREPEEKSRPLLIRHQTQLRLLLLFHPIRHHRQHRQYARP